MNKIIIKSYKVSFKINKVSILSKKGTILRYKVRINKK